VMGTSLTRTGTGLHLGGRSPPSTNQKPSNTDIGPSVSRVRRERAMPGQAPSVVGPGGADSMTTRAEPAGVSPKWRDPAARNSGLTANCTGPVGGREGRLIFTRARTH